MRDRADEALPCNRPSTLRQAQGPQGWGAWTLRQAQGPQGTPLTVWLIKKADIVRKRDFHKDKSLFLWNISGKSLSLHRKREKSYEYDRN